MRIELNIFGKWLGTALGPLIYTSTGTGQGAPIYIPIGCHAKPCATCNGMGHLETSVMDETYTPESYVDLHPALPPFDAEDGSI